jgi:cytoskeleton protein RodZ
MSDQPDSTAPASAAPPRPTTAGGLLRQARQAQGLHIAALAAAIKVVPRKLELLESDQFDQLPDVTFTRALAHSVCRTLKVDSAPVLALLPPLNGHRLEQVAEGLNTPFRERPGRLVPKDWANVASPVLWIAALIVVLTVAVYVMPAHWLPFSIGGATRPGATDASTSVTAAVPTPPATASTNVTPEPAPVSDVPAVVESTAPEAAAAASAEPEVAAAAAPTGVLQFRATAPSWVGVTDARGQSLISRVIQPGESVGLDGAMPMKVKIGNVIGTQVVFKGQPFELAAYTRDNVARFELK